MFILLHIILESLDSKKHLSQFWTCKKDAEFYCDQCKYEHNSCPLDIHHHLSRHHAHNSCEISKLCRVVDYCVGERSVARISRDSTETSQKVQERSYIIQNSSLITPQLFPLHTLFTLLL